VSHNKYFMVSTLERGLKILELLVEKQRLSVSEVARHFGIQRSAAHRFLSTLKEMAYVDQDDTSRYVLTSRLSHLAGGRVPSLSIRRTARPFLQELADITHETVNLGHWTGKTIAYMDQIHSDEMLRADLSVGNQIPAYCSALGKAVLAFIPKSELEKFFNTIPLKPLTSNSMTSREAITEELKTIRNRGYSIDNEELGLGIRAIAVPILLKDDYPSYAVSIAGPTFRMTDGKISRLKDELVRVGRELQEELS